MSRFGEHLDIERAESSWRTLMSHSWMNSAKNVNVLAPADKIFFFFYWSGKEVLGQPRHYRSKTI